MLRHHNVERDAVPSGTGTGGFAQCCCHCAEAVRCVLVAPCCMHGYIIIRWACTEHLHARAAAHRHPMLMRTREHAHRASHATGTRVGRAFSAAAALSRGSSACSLRPRTQCVARVAKQDEALDVEGGGEEEEEMG